MVLDVKCTNEHISEVRLVPTAQKTLPVDGLARGDRFSISIYSMSVIARDVKFFHRTQHAAS